MKYPLIKNHRFEVRPFTLAGISGRASDFFEVAAIPGEALINGIVEAKSRPKVLVAGSRYRARPTSLFSDKPHERRVTADGLFGFHGTFCESKSDTILYRLSQESAVPSRKMNWQQMPLAQKYGVVVTLRNPSSDADGQLGPHGELISRLTKAHQ